MTHVEAHPVLLRPHQVQTPLDAVDLRCLGSIATRRELEQSPIYQSKGAAIDALCFATEYHPCPVSPATASPFIRVASWNAQRGIHLDGMLGLLSTHPVLRDLDVLLLNEVDLGMARSGNRNVARELASSLGMGYVFANSYLCLDHGDVRDPKSSEENRIGLHGNAILSRFPLSFAENVSLAISRDKFESQSEKRLGQKKALWARFETPLGELCVASAHLDPIATPQLRAAQLEDLLSLLDRRKVASLVLAGDLNTNTYDLGSLPRLLANVALKGLRGGFAHAIHHYMNPWKLYERPVFDVLARHRLEYRGLNDLYSGTLRYEVGSFDSESKVRDFLPAFAVDFLRRRLRPWNGIAPLRVDWLCARGFVAAGEGELVDVRGRSSVAPGVVEGASWQGRRLSDHDPVYADLLPLPRTAVYGVS